MTSIAALPSLLLSADATPGKGGNATEDAFAPVLAAMLLASDPITVPTAVPAIGIGAPLSGMPLPAMPLPARPRSGLAGLAMEVPPSGVLVQPGRQPEPMGADEPSPAFGSTFETEKEADRPPSPGGDVVVATAVDLCAPVTVLPSPVDVSGNRAAVSRERIAPSAAGSSEFVDAEAAIIRPRGRHAPVTLRPARFAAAAEARGPTAERASPPNRTPVAASIDPDWLAIAAPPATMVSPTEPSSGPPLTFAVPDTWSSVGQPGPVIAVAQTPTTDPDATMPPVKARMKAAGSAPLSETATAVSAGIAAPIAPLSMPVAQAVPATIAASLSTGNAAISVAPRMRSALPGLLATPAAMPTVAAPAGTGAAAAHPADLLSGAATTMIGSTVAPTPGPSAAVASFTLAMPLTASPPPIEAVRATTPPQTRAEIGSDTRTASRIEPAAAPSLSSAIFPTFETFGAALHRAAVAERRPSAFTSSAVPDIQAIAAPGSVAIAALPESAPVDTTRPTWPQTMVAQIERLRDLHNEGDTRIRLLPDALGPVDVTLRRDANAGAVQVELRAAEPATRALLAEAQPRLQELAESRGLRLTTGDAAGGLGQHAGQNTGQGSTGSDRRQPTPSTSSRAPAAAVAADPSTDTRLA